MKPWRSFYQVMTLGGVVFGHSLGAAGDAILPGFPVIADYHAPEIPTMPVTYSLQRTPSGGLVVGGHDILSYDGTGWTDHRLPGVIGILDIDFDPSGKMWVAAEGDVGWVDTPPGKPWRFHSLRPHIPQAERLLGLVYHVEATDRAVAFFTESRIYLWDGNTMRSWPGSFRAHRLYTINGDFIFHHLGVGLQRLTVEGLEPVAPDQFGATEPAQIRWVQSDGESWVVNRDGRFIVHVKGEPRELPPETSRILIEHGAATMVSGPDGRLAFFTYPPFGIAVVGADGALEQIITPAEGLAKIRGMLGDPDGYLWIASETGVQRVNLGTRTRIFDERAGLPANAYMDIAATRERVVAGVAQNMFTAPTTGRTFSRPAGFEALTSVAAVHADGESLLMSTGSALLRLDADGKTTQVASIDRGAESILRSRVKPAEILVGLYDLTVRAISEEGGTTTLARDLPVVPASLAEDSEGMLWVGTDTRGVFVTPRHATSAAIPTVPGPETGLPTISGQAHVRASPNGDIIIVSDSGGWARSAGERRFQPIRNYPSRPLAASAHVLPDHTLWVAHELTDELSPTLAQISRSGGEWSWSAHTVPDLDRVGPPCGLSAVPGDDGTVLLWIGGSQAVLRHVVTRGPEARVPAAPRVAGHARRAQGDVQPIASPLPFTISSIAFQYAPWNYGGGTAVRFETRVEGLDDDWQPPTRQSRRELSGLRDGRYVFKVRTVAETGLRSEPAVFAFEVLPPWWRTNTALWLEAAGILAVALAGFHWRTRALRERARVLEQKVQERTEELVAANAAKTQFVANMSHDIRNPLNGIIGMTLALDDTPLDGQQRELVSTLRECTSYLSSLVDDVLDFASIEAGKFDLRPAPFAPSELLNSVVSTLRTQAAEASASVAIEADPDLPPLLQGDAGRIQQVLVNYVSNALKYAPGHVRLVATVPVDGPGEVEFYVADEGPGIGLAEQATLFTKFSRLKSARERHIAGTGLGLASCRLLADAMGGSVGIDSAPGRGSRFFLRLPLIAATEPVAAADGLDFPATTVLLVEDTDYNAVAARAVLRRLGLTCDRASTGEEAIRMFAEKRHAIVLLDRNLPDLDGTEVARRMREIETDGLRALLLAVTAYATAEDRQHCIEAGMDAFVGKPLTPEKLRKSLLASAGPLAAAAAHAVAPMASQPAVPPFDLSILNYLAEGSPGGLAAQAERFVAELNAAFQAVQAASPAMDLTLADAAHRLLGSARMVAATRLTTLCSELEDAARRREEPAVRTLVPQLTVEVAALTAAMRHRSRVARV